MAKLAAHLLVKNEEDIIKECLDHLANFCDYILVLDTGSTDKTYEICKEHRSITYVEKREVVYSDALRQILVEKSREFLTPQDWFLAVSADHFFASNPKEDIEKAISEGANVITYEVAQFYLTDMDYRASIMNPDWKRIPVQKRLFYYAINWHNFPVTFQNQPNLRYMREVTEWPDLPEKKIASFHPITKHYQFRDIEQIRRRLRERFGQRRKGFKGFRHYRCRRWQRYIFNHRRFHKFDGTWMWDKQPSINELISETASPWTKLFLALKQKLKSYGPTKNLILIIKRIIFKKE